MAQATQFTIVTPSDETPKHKIYLSNLDIVAARGYTPTIYVYPSTGIQDFFPAEAFKASLAKALVVFYPLAGRLSRDPETGRPEIDCTGEGVHFFTADLDATVDDFKDFTPSTEMRKKLVPVVDSADPPCIIMAIQVSTEIQHPTESVLWKWETGGLFSTASTYKVLHTRGVNCQFARRLWKFKTPPKVRVFVWVLLQNKLLTREVLMRRGCPTMDGCVMCGLNIVESSVHLFWECTYSAAFWWALMRSLQRSPPSRAMHSHVAFWIAHSQAMDKIQKREWDAIWAAGLWALWRERNNRYFSQKTKTIRILLGETMTRLRCGGIILGFANHHYIIDGRSVILFIKTLSSFARGDASTIPTPFFDHSLLRARSPPSVCFDHSDCTPKVNQSKGPSNTSSQVICSNLKLTKEQIHLLKILEGGERVSTFSAVVAHLWKCICIARGLASDVETQLILPVDISGRFKPPLPATYFGNTTVRTKAVAKVKDLMSNTLEFAANLIQNAVDNITDEFGRSLIDHLESTDLEVPGKSSAMSNTSLTAISWLSFPMYDADFGWGEPTLMARAEMYRSGYRQWMGMSYLSRVPAMDGGISMMVGLEPDSMQCLKKILYDEIEAPKSY